MANNKIILGEEVLIDLTQDTVTPDSLVEGTTAHDASGNVIEGTRKPSFALEELDDVNIENPKKDDVLGYDPDTDTWINKKGGNDVDLIVVDGKLNQIYNPDGATEDTETTDAIVLDSTAREFGTKLDDITVAIEKLADSRKQEYTLPIATDLVLGGVRIGSNLEFNEQGIVNAIVPTKVSELANDERYLKDSDISQWAKEDTKPTYTYDEVGALPNTTTHLNGDIAVEEKGANNGVAPLDENGIIPSSHLPSYVDDVIECDTVDDFPTEGESGKIYVDTATNVSYRWSGTQYVKIASDLALGETSSTAYAGDKGKATTDEFNQHKTNTDIHVSIFEKQTWNGKQNALTETQLDAVDSGITPTKVETYDGYKSKIDEKYVKPSDGIPKTDLSSDVQSSLDKADSALQSYTETDPTVPSWAKEPEKPTYTADEVGALPNTISVQPDVDLAVVNGALNQTYDPSGSVGDTTNAIVLDSTAKVLNQKLDNIASAINTHAQGVTFRANGKNVECSIDGTNWKTIVTFD